LILLLTGPPGAGKTTAMARLAERLRASGRKLAGFYTREVRERGRRVGFDIETLDGKTGVLARTGLKGPARVGSYGVDVEGFERLALDSLSGAPEVFIIDEIGKMEGFCLGFVRRARELLQGEAPVAATVAEKGGGLIEEAKSSPGAELIEISAQNRDALPAMLEAKVVEHLKREEERKMRRLRRIADVTQALLQQSGMSLQDCRLAVEEARKAALSLFPDKGAEFDLIYAPRFERIIRERFARAHPDGGGQTLL